jgi:flavin reductase (DIM6/NTAB) family NADH-FMN oxidoreductase RutF
LEQQSEVSIAPGDLHPRDAYRLFISVVVPRPIAWVSSMGADGSLNLAPFSFFNGVGGTPPTIMVSVGQRAGVPKDTLRNVRETGEFVVHIVNEEFAERMNVTSGEWPYEVDEFALAGLATLPCVHVKPPRIAGAPIAMEVRATQFIPVQDTHYTMILGQVLRYHIRESLLTPSTSVDPMRLRSIARLGGPDYTAIDRIFSLKRPDV